MPLRRSEAGDQRPNREGDDRNDPRGRVVLKRRSGAVVDEGEDENHERRGRDVDPRAAVVRLIFDALRLFVVLAICG